MIKVSTNNNKNGLAYSSKDINRNFRIKVSGVQGGATLWKLTQAITAHARELTPERSRELHELSGQLMNRVKLNK